MHCVLNLFIPSTILLDLLLIISGFILQERDFFHFEFEVVVESLYLWVDHVEFGLEFWYFVDLVGELFDPEFEFFVFFVKESYFCG